MSGWGCCGPCSPVACCNSNSAVTPAACPSLHPSARRCCCTAERRQPPSTVRGKCTEGVTRGAVQQWACCSWGAAACASGAATSRVACCDERQAGSNKTQPQRYTADRDTSRSRRSHNDNTAWAAPGLKKRWHLWQAPAGPAAHTGGALAGAPLRSARAAPPATSGTGWPEYCLARPGPGACVSRMSACGTWTSTSTARGRGAGASPPGRSGAPPSAAAAPPGGGASAAAATLRRSRSCRQAPHRQAAADLTRCRRADVLQAVWTPAPSHSSKENLHISATAAGAEPHRAENVSQTA